MAIYSFLLQIDKMLLTEEIAMKLKKQIFLPILLSLSMFFASTVMMSASAYAAVTPQAPAVYELAEAAPNNTEIPRLDPGKESKSGSAKAKDDSSFFEQVFEKLAVMFLVYMFLEAIHAILNDFFHEGNGDFKIKVTPKEKQDGPDSKGTNQKNMKRLPAQDV